MSDSLTERLDAILPRITSEEFLEAKGLGNEIAFFIFDYPPESELVVRQHIRFLLDQIPKRKPHIRLMHINLFEFVINHLRSRKLLDKTFELQRQKGDEFVLKQLEKVLHPEKLAPLLAEAIQPHDQDLVLVSGIGSVWPLLRTHSLLNNLHPIMGRTPLVIFYPGRYDQKTLRLFNKIKSNNYYRAFRLIP
ncbi:DUF1788 domain-containing protein [Candidatus Laterigemmans baculatus]|uniref:DUF1788 domain-containing protein n=1 Tax=Candidatus Laterigemmans baculatus TaxID=2770505 RepID=UPI0013DCA927|nr:DUF1788 domain-containing protein [Candidatus Laterigemmans baculatus]